MSSMQESVYKPFAKNESKQIEGDAAGFGQPPALNSSEPITNSPAHCDSNPRERNKFVAGETQFNREKTHLLYEENTDSVGGDHQPRGRLASRHQPRTGKSGRHKKYTILLVAAILVVTAVSICPLTIGGMSLKALVPKPEDSHEVIRDNDMIVLQQDLKSGYSSIQVDKCGNSNDEHIINVSLVASENVKVILNDSQWPSYDSENIEWLYLQPGSNFTYNVCIASTTSETQYATYFLFTGSENHTQYARHTTDGEKYSSLTRNLTALSNNRNTCYPISSTINTTAYYFMMLNSPGGINISYHFSLHKVEYIPTKIEKTQNFSSTVTLPLANHWPLSQAKYYVFAKAYYFTGEPSITTPVCTSKLQTSEALKNFVTFSFVFLAILLILAFLFVVALVYNCKKLYKRPSHPPTQSTYDSIN